ncbi:hypothetical protein E2C01_066375 [Portunus trituberculatus]|uniref:Uncharacterized protein n=1 Tax=Portunus trituberculatus TaxID=210409 RepID=A0A5B7HLB9_PORTR|nr:hypothetical protein [Portunus trituberculatus]
MQITKQRNETWVWNERQRSRFQAEEMSYLKDEYGVSEMVCVCGGECERREKGSEHVEREWKDRNKWRLFCGSHPLSQYEVRESNMDRLGRVGHVNSRGDEHRGGTRATTPSWPPVTWRHCRDGPYGDVSRHFTGPRVWCVVALPRASSGRAL